MGSVHEYRNTAGEKRYRIVYRDASHKQTSQRGFETQRKAKSTLNKIETAIEEGKHIPRAKGKIQLHELAESWLATKKAVLKESSYTVLESAWRTHVSPTWGEKQIGQIARPDVQAWINNLDRGTSVKRRAAEVFASILDTAVPTRISENPARGLVLPARAVATRHRYLTHTQLWKLAESAGDNKLMILVLGYCGIRWGEMTALTVDSLDPDKQLIHIERNVVSIGSKLVEGTPKSHKVRRVPVPSTIWELLKDRCKGRKPHELIFGNAYGTFISPPSGGRSGRNWYNSALTKANLRQMRVHDLRHTAASLAVQAGANVKEVQRMLGHRSAAITLDIYTDLFDEDFEDLIGRLDNQIASTFVANSVASEPAGTEKDPNNG